MVGFIFYGRGLKRWRFRGNGQVLVRLCRFICVFVCDVKILNLVAVDLLLQQTVMVGIGCSNGC